MTKQLEQEREPLSTADALKAHVEAQLAAAVEKKMAMQELELGEGLPPDEWEIYAWGPYQFRNGVFNPSVNPGRIIFTGETAYVAVAVWMNPHMCRVITDHQDKIMLEIWTSDMQNMRAASGLSETFCIETVQGGPCFYVVVWEFTPEEAACLYETNICARICNCNNNTLQDYAAFVRQVYDFDPETLWVSPPVTPGWGFDRPIRFMVADPQSACDC